MTGRPGPRWRAPLAALALAAVTLGCATREPAREGAADRGTAGVEVINRVQPPSTVSVYIDEEPGGRMFLGTIEPGVTRTLVVRTVRPTVDYRLEARTDAGRDIVSGRFTLSPGETVVWNLRTNVLGP